MKMDGLGRLGHFVSAGLVRRRIGGAICSADEAVGQQIRFDFFATDVRQHLAIDFHTRAEHLAAFFDHLLSLHRVVDDVTIFVWQVVFAHDGADALTPATRRFQISNDLWFVHS